MVAADLEVEVPRGPRPRSRARQIGVVRLTCAILTATGGGARHGAGHHSDRRRSGGFNASRILRPYLVQSVTWHARLPAAVRASGGVGPRTGPRHRLQVLRTAYPNPGCVDC